MATKNLISKIRNFDLHLAEVIYKRGLQCRLKYCILEGHEDLLIFHNDFKLLTMFICYGIYRLNPFLTDVPTVVQSFQTTLDKKYQFYKC